MSRYISTRGPGPLKNFSDVLMDGMAADGGLYIPHAWPSWSPESIARFSGLSYADIAFHLMTPFIGDALPPAVLQKILQETYQAEVFDHRAVAPLTQIGPNAWLLELFHGPTFSFKDIALQFLGAVFDHVLHEKAERITIVGATSGDTGSAAIEACKGCRNIDIFILHPLNRTSEIQRRQMTSVNAPNVFNLAVEGTFDDCQAIVKALFADRKLTAERRLSAVNSINWVRIMAQSVYYFAAALAVGAPARPVRFAVPTGNFGNVYAAFAARQMGLPIERLVIGSNRNDILTRFFETGEMKAAPVVPSLSPSMDIQVSSNFERYLCEISGRDHKALSSLMASFAETGSFKVDADTLARARRDFAAHRCSDEETIAAMKACFAETGLQIDPHTAVGLHAAAMDSGVRDPSVPLIVLACAHPAKFPDAVRQATGRDPVLPSRLDTVMKRAELFTPIAADVEKVKAFIRSNRN